MLRGTTNLVDLGKFTGDHISDDESRVEAHPDLQPGIAQAYDTPNQLDGCMAGKWRMIVISYRSPKGRRQPVTHFLADDAPELTHGGSHRPSRRLKTRQCLLWSTPGYEVRRRDHGRRKYR